MKYLNKFKKDFVINTKYVKNTEFNEPIYVISNDKTSVNVYNINKKNKVSIKNVEIKDELTEKTFISVKEFFKKCKPDNTEYKIERVNNGDIYIRIAYFEDLSLFYRISDKNKFILTNINKYNFVKTNNDTLQALQKVEKYNVYDIERANAYLKNKKSIKRDYLFAIKRGLQAIEDSYKYNK